MRRPIWRSLGPGAPVRWRQWHNGRDLSFFALSKEAVLLLNLLACPPARPVELDHPKGIPASPFRIWIDVELNLVHTILHAIERQYAARAPRPKALDRIEDPLWSELKEELCRRRGKICHAGSLARIGRLRPHFGQSLSRL